MKIVARSKAPIIFHLKNVQIVLLILGSWSSATANIKHMKMVGLQDEGMFFRPGAGWLQKLASFFYTKYPLTHL